MFCKIILTGIRKVRVWFVAAMFLCVMSSVHAGVQLEWLGSSSDVSEGVLSIEDDNGFVKHLNHKVVNAILLSWSSNSNKKYNPHNFAVDYYSLKQHHNSCVQRVDGSCTLDYIGLESTFLVYRYKLATGIYFGLGAGISGKSEEMFYAVNGVERTSFEASDMPLYGVDVGFSTVRASGFTIGMRYFWTPTTEYVFTRRCIKELDKTESCEIIPDNDGEEKRFSYNLFGFTVGWAL